MILHLIEGLVDEDDGDEAGEALLCEPGDEGHQGGQVKGGHQHQDEGRPESDPHPERKEVPGVVSGRSRDKTQLVSDGLRVRYGVQTSIKVTFCLSSKTPFTDYRHNLEKRCSSTHVISANSFQNHQHIQPVLTTRDISHR